LRYDFEDVLDAEAVLGTVLREIRVGVSGGASALDVDGTEPRRLRVLGRRPTQIPACLSGVGARGPLGPAPLVLSPMPS
jgi:hypothetical protein